MVPSNGGDYFRERVHRDIGRRAGYRCSRPECGAPTEGPQQQGDKGVTLGVAAHITANAVGGPRYDPSLSPKERRSAVNGIWLCQNCAKLIDSDVNKYTVQLLQHWKAVRVCQAATELGESDDGKPVEVSGEHRAEGVGDITGLDVEGPAIIKPGTRVSAKGFGNVTGTRIGRRDKG